MSNNYDITEDGFKQYLKDNTTETDGSVEVEASPYLLEDLKEALERRSLDPQSEEAYLYSFTSIIGGSTEVGDKILNQEIREIEDLEEYSVSDLEKLRETELMDYEDWNSHGSPSDLPQSLENLKNLDIGGLEVSSFSEFYDVLRNTEDWSYRNDPEDLTIENRPIDRALRSFKDTFSRGRVHAMDFLKAGIEVHGQEWMVPDKKYVMRPSMVDNEGPKNAIASIYNRDEWQKNGGDSTIEEGIKELEDYARDELGWSNKQIVLNMETLLCDFKMNEID